MNSKIYNFLRKDINLLGEYEIPYSEGMIKLDAMENPYDLLVKFKTFSEDIETVESNVNLNRYPQSNCENLKITLHKYYGLTENIDSIIGNGSDELIQLICLAFLKPENILLFPKPTFSMYKKISEVLGLKYEEVPLLDDFSLDMDLMVNKIEELNPAIIFLAYPNNPTGNLWKKDNINLILNKTNGVVVLDEAYSAFSGKSFVNEIEKNDNLLVMKTFSKIGLAGLRLGYLFGEKTLIKNFNKLRLPFNVNSVSQKICELYIDNKTLNDQINRLIKNRGLMLEEMKNIKNLIVYNSDANFILFRVTKGSSNEVYTKLLSDNILVKNMTNSPGLVNCMRVTVGSQSENEKFIQSLKNSVN